MSSLTPNSTFNYYHHSLLTNSKPPPSTSPFSFKLKTSPLSFSPSPNLTSTPTNHSFYTTPFPPFFTFFKLLKTSALFLTNNWVSKLQAYYHVSHKEMEEEFQPTSCLHNTSFGLALLSITSNAKVKISPFLSTLAANPTFMSGLLAWFVAQSMKVFLNFFVERKWDFRILFASGGMPSSHSALCTALTTSVAICHGVADSLFPVCLGFSLIVMYDAIGVRRHAGMQAEVLNLIVEDLFQGHPISQRKLKELLGHTPSQVFAGAVLGILVAYACCQGFLVVT